MRPIPDDETFTRAEPTPEAALRYEAAARYARRRHGRAVIVIEGTTITWEEHTGGHEPTWPTHVFSGTKSFTCAVAVAAAEDGVIGLDDPVGPVLEAWRADPRGELTPRQLLQQVSGLDKAFFRLTLDALRRRQRVADKGELALSRRLRDPPGTRFRYGSVHFQAWAEVMEARLGEPPLGYLERRIFEPIGLRHGPWTEDPSGSALFAVGAWLTPLEWAKYGVLVRDDGAWEGEQLLQPGALASCLEGSAVMPAYGVGFWLNAAIEPGDQRRFPGTLKAARPEEVLLPGGPDDLVAAVGFHCNRLYIIPSMDLVVVRLGRNHWRWRDREFLGLLLGVEG